MVRRRDGFSVQVEVDPKKLERDLDRAVVRQLPFAQALAATRIGQRIKQAEYRTMQSVFDRPSRFTLNSLMLTPAKKSNPEAMVWFKDFAPKGTPAAKYLLPQVYGGKRSAKRSEIHLRRSGIIGPNQFLTPGTEAKLDRYGNISRGQMQKVLSNLRAQFDPKQNTPVGRTPAHRKGTARTSYFAGRPGGNKAFGIYQREGRSVKPFMAVVKAPTYQKRFDFFGIAERQMAKYYDHELRQALLEAIASAR